MRRAIRVGLVVLGATMAIYGAASLTGGWLGTPPWWETHGTLALDGMLHDRGVATAESPPPEPEVVALPAPNRERTSTIVTTLGLALVALVAWPRRRRVEARPTVG